ncbi:MAG: hypothetical protein HGA65_15620, partial [Oscillochloris sp.]|nr:hypothetical protein [Oscillochloris sp.]
GQTMQAAAAEIPERFVAGLRSDTMSLEDLKDLKAKLTILIDHLS